MGKTPIRKYKKKHTLIHQTKTSNRNKTSKRSKKINLFEVIVPAFLSFFVHSTLVSQQKNNFFLSSRKNRQIFCLLFACGEVGLFSEIKVSSAPAFVATLLDWRILFFIINLDLDYFFSTAENRRREVRIVF